MARSRAVPEYFTPPPPRVLAHRGLATTAPENTLLAFLHALNIGVTHLETDVQVSADGRAIVSHDPSLGRMVGREVRIDQLTTAELRRIDLGSGQGFSTLAEVLDAFPDARFNIDIKAAGAADPAAADIRSLNAHRRVLIGSFSASRRLATIRQLPGVATSASARASVAAVQAARVRALGPLRRILRNVDAVQLPQTIGGARTATARSVASFHAAGVEIHVWTVNDPVQMAQLLDLGVHGIVTDRADLGLDLLARRNAGG